jgi:hypothetical protein
MWVSLTPVANVLHGEQDNLLPRDTVRVRRTFVELFFLGSSGGQASKSGLHTAASWCLGAALHWEPGTLSYSPCADGGCCVILLRQGFKLK